MALQGKTVLKNFDIIADAGGTMRCTVKEFTDVAVAETCELTFTARHGDTLLSGIEFVSTGMPLDSIVVMKQ